jgi:3-hexulose-6-phosphate synthase
MKLQLALDTLSLTDALSLVRDVEPYIDIIEIGTPFLLEEGMKAVTTMKAEFPSLEILADTKIMDAGELEANLAFKAGADYITVLGVTDSSTITACIETAKRYGKKVVVDMICVHNMEERIAELEKLGPVALAVHTGVDQQKAGRTPLDDLALMREFSKSSEIFVAGGISATTIGEYLKYLPDVIIVGSGICSAAHPASQAKAIYSILHRNNYTLNISPTE